MDLSRAARLLYRPSGSINAVELAQADKYLRHCCSGYCKKFYEARTERLELCRSTFAALLVVVDDVRTCGPAWFFWQFPVYRLISTLTPFFRSRRYP